MSSQSSPHPPSNTAGAATGPPTGASALTSMHSTGAPEMRNSGDERAQLLEMRRRTRALFSGTGRFSTIPTGYGGRQAQSCARLTAALPAILPPKVPRLKCAVVQHQAQLTPRSTKPDVAASPAVSAPSTPTVATVSGVNSSKSRIRSKAAESMSNSPTTNFLFRAVGAPLNGRQSAQVQATRSSMTSSRPVSSGQPRSATVKPFGSRDGHTTKRWCDVVHDDGSCSSSGGTPESIVRHHKNVAAVSLSTSARRRLETCRMNSRKAIYVLNAALKRRADAQFEKLAAEKAAEAKAEEEAEEEEEDKLLMQLRQQENSDHHLTGAEVTADDTGGDCKVMRPVQVVPARCPDDDGADVVTEEQTATQISDGTAEIEVQRMATQRSLLEGMTAAGVLTDQQCEAAVAKLATQKLSCVEKVAEQDAHDNSGLVAEVADRRDSGADQ